MVRSESVLSVSLTARLKDEQTQKISSGFAYIPAEPFCHNVYYAIAYHKSENNLPQHISRMKGLQFLEETRNHPRKSQPG
jgi:hypothetical protein